MAFTPLALTLSISDLRKADACDLEERIEDLLAHHPNTKEEDALPIQLWWALDTTSVADMFWALHVAKPALAARRVGAQAASAAARRALDSVREQGRPAALAAIEAAETWALDPTEENRNAAASCAILAAAASYTAASYAACAAFYAAASAAASAASATISPYAIAECSAQSKELLALVA
jgi:hypothetical protein